MAENEKPRANWYWPKIVDVVSAKEAAKAGYWAALIVAAITAVVATVALLTGTTPMAIDPWAYLDAAVFAFLAWRIRRYSKVFAVAAIVLFVAERAYLAQSQGAAGWPLAVVLLLMFISGARGVFGVHRFSKTPVSAAGGAQDV